MSALTRGRRGNFVTFTDKSGKVVHGVILDLRSDCAVVGVQPSNRPLVHNGKRMTHNNQLWVVPFTSITETHLMRPSQC